MTNETLAAAEVLNAQFYRAVADLSPTLDERLSSLVDLPVASPEEVMELIFKLERLYAYQFGFPTPHSATQSQLPESTVGDH